MAFPPILALALAGGAAYLLMAPKKATPAAGAGANPEPNTWGGIPNMPGGVTIPTGDMPPHPDVTPENTPTVTVQVPHATGDKSDQFPPVQQATPPGSTTVTLPGNTPVVIPPINFPSTNPIPIPSTATPVQHEETKADQDPHGTVALAKLMIDAESTSNWKTALQSMIAAWQSQVGLKSDGRFGPGSAAAMAQEVGVLPLIRFYPKGTQLKADLQAYRDLLYTMAANFDSRNPAHAAALRSSAQYETGQAYTGTPKAIPASSRIAQAALLNKSLGA
jgi:hypothetical protein